MCYYVAQSQCLLCLVLLQSLLIYAIMNRTIKDVLRICRFTYSFEEVVVSNLERDSASFRESARVLIGHPKFFYRSFRQILLQARNAPHIQQRFFHPRNPSCEKRNKVMVNHNIFSLAAYFHPILVLTGVFKSGFYVIKVHILLPIRNFGTTRFSRNFMIAKKIPMRVRTPSFLILHFFVPKTF
jgi:hypothetical protein